MRAFAALYPDSEALEEIKEIQRNFIHIPAPVKWESPEKIHITMKFIEEISPEDMSSTIDALRGDISALDRMRYEIRRVDAFPSIRRPRIIWVGGGDPPEGMLPMHRWLDEAFAGAGVERERKKFTPHFTIGRVKHFGNTRDLINLLESCSFQPFDTVFTELRFMESRLTPEGAVHEEIDRVSFQ